MATWQCWRIPFCGLGGPIWPRRGYWLNHRPDESDVELRRNVRIDVLLKFLVPLLAAMVLQSYFNGHFMVCIIFSVYFPLCVAFYWSRDIVRRRHFVYAFLLCNACLAVLTAIADPVDAHAIAIFMIRRAANLALMIIIQIFALGKVSVGVVLLLVPSTVDPEKEVRSEPLWA